MRARLRGAVGGGSARRGACEPLYLQMCAAEKRGSELGLDFPQRPHAHGINRYTSIPLPLLNPASTDTLSVG